MADEQKKDTTTNENRGGTNSKELLKKCRRTGDFSEWQVNNIYDVIREYVEWYIFKNGTLEDAEWWYELTKDKDGVTFDYRTVRSDVAERFFPKVLEKTKTSAAKEKLTVNQRALKNLEEKRAAAAAVTVIPSMVGNL